MNVDLRVIQPTQNSGLRQTNPGAFTAGAEGLARLGESMQSVGQIGVEYASAQQALHNDNLKVQGEQKFTKFMQKGLLDAEFGELQEDGTRKLPDVVQMGPQAIKNMTTEQQKILKDIPALRQAGFLKNTNAQILAANGKLAGLANGRVMSDARALDIQFKNELEASAFSYPPEVLKAKKKEYLSRLARGVVTGAYDPDDAARLAETFKEDLADTLQNAKTSAMFQTQFTVADLEQRDKEISEDPDLNPKEKFLRIDNMWRRSSAITARRRTALEKEAKEKSTNARIQLYETLIDPALNPDGSLGPQQEDLDQAIEDGLRHAPTIEKFQKMINKSERLETLGSEDNNPAQGYLDQMSDLEFMALDKNWDSEKLSTELNKIRTKVRNEHANDVLEKLTSKELKEINSTSTSILKTFKDEDKKKLATAKNDATKSLKDRLGGGDKAFKRFNFRRNEIVNDAIEAAHLLIERGMDDDKAVEKILTMVVDDENEGVQSFSASDFKRLLKDASRGKLSDSVTYQVEQMLERAKKNPPTRQPENSGNGANTSDTTPVMKTK